MKTPTILITLIVALCAAQPRSIPTEPPVLANPPLSRSGTAVTPPPNAKAPSYHDDQARKGQTVYYESCAECHAADGSGKFAPALLTDAGNVQWQPIYYVFTYMQQHMPEGNAKGLSTADYVNIMAFLMKSHGYAPGRAALTPKSLEDSRAFLGGKP